MQVTKQEAFTPVAITLETREEVDKMYALFNYSPIADALELRGWYTKLQPYRTFGHDKWHNKLCEAK